MSALPSTLETDTAESALWRRLRSDGDLQARALLIERYLPYARVVAASYYGRRLHDEIEFADYLQLASMAVVESVDRFEANEGAQFKTFAARRMHGAILNGIEKMTEKQQQIAARQRLRQERLDEAKAQGADAAAALTAGERVLTYLAEVGVGLALGMLLEGTGMFDPDARERHSEPEAHYRQVEMAQLRQRVLELVKRLPDAQRRVLQWHYFEERNFAIIADTLSLTRGRVSQIHKQALQALRSALADGRCDLAC